MGTVAMDSAGTHHGVFAAGTWTTTGRGQPGVDVAAFTPEVPGVAVPDAQEFQLQGDFTIATVFELTGLAPTNEVVLVGRHQGEPQLDNWGMVMSTLGLHFRYYSPATSLTLPLGTTGPHCLVLSRSSTTLRAWLEGVEIASLPDPPVPVASGGTATELRIGGATYGPFERRAFPGAIMDLRIWSRALSNVDAVSYCDEFKP